MTMVATLNGLPPLKENPSYLVLRSSKSPHNALYSPFPVSYIRCQLKVKTALKRFLRQKMRFAL
jgi:hypothetical protein